MRGYNRAVIMGNLTKDPDIRFTPNKQKVARFTVAVGRQWKDKSTGQMQSHTDFINVVAWSFLADICEKYVQKGKPVLVEGRISVRDYDDQKAGQKRWITEIVADNIVLLGSGSMGSGGGGSNVRVGSGGGGYQPKTGASGDTGYTQPTFEDDFPLDLSAADGPDADIPF